MPVNGITAVVLTKDEEEYITDCLNSLRWCDEVLVLDSLSTDRTREIALQLGAEVVCRPFQDFGDQRNAAIRLVKSEWILFVDADERVTEELAQEIMDAIHNPDYDGWWIPTKNYYFGRWLNYGIFYPSYHLRLARTAKIHYDSNQKVHEVPTLDGKAGYLRNPLIHIGYQSLRELKTAGERYASLRAEVSYEKGIKPTYHFIAAPILTFFEQFLVKQGYRGGWVGLLMSLAMSYYAFDEYRRLWILWKTAGKKGTE